MNIDLSDIHLKSPYSSHWGQLFQSFSRHLAKDPNHLIKHQIKHLYQEIIKSVQPSPPLSFLSSCIFPAPLINIYFDRIYVLNLDSRPDRMRHMADQLSRLQISNYQRWPAVCGKEEPHYSEWKRYSRVPMTRIERTRYQRKGIASAGSWGILKSMYLILRDAQDNRYQRILVFQDDLLFHKHFHQEFESLISHLPPNHQPKLLYLGATQHAWSHVTFNKSHKFYHPNGTADGAFAVGINSSVFQELIEEILEFELPVDSGALKTLQKRHNTDCLIAYPNIAIADIRDSDLRGYRNLELFSKKFRWDLNNYHVVDTLKPEGSLGGISDEW